MRGEDWLAPRLPESPQHQDEGRRVIEPTETGFSALFPIFPAASPPRQLLRKHAELIREAIEFHVEGMRMNGERVPEPTRFVEQVVVSA